MRRKGSESREKRWVRAGWYLAGYDTECDRCQSLIFKDERYYLDMDGTRFEEDWDEDHGEWCPKVQCTDCKEANPTPEPADEEDDDYVGGRHIKLRPPLPETGTGDSDHYRRLNRRRYLKGHNDAGMP